jgi:glycosyltransferase involved in cell wall biosynthesis
MKAGLDPLVVHVSPRVQGRGGIETLHDVHRGLPGRQVFVALFDRAGAPRPDYVNLNFTWRTPLWRMRRQFGVALARFPGAVVVYHNGWGLPLFHDLDGAARRVIFLHGNPVYHAPELAAFRGLVDGIIGVTPALAEVWTALLPEVPPGHTAVLRAPVTPPPGLQVERAGARPVVLGYAGRLERLHKRLDRLPALLRELRTQGVDFRFEVLGDGTLRRELERQTGEAVNFHGWVSREELWRVMGTWDAMVFFSEVEGGPIAMFEGMALGLVPFYPDTRGSWGDIYAPQVHASCHYPAGDMKALALAVGEIFRLPAAELSVLRLRASQLIRPHQLQSYLAECGGFLREIASRPKISQSRRRLMRPTDALPLGLVTRLFEWTLRFS